MNNKKLVYRITVAFVIVLLGYNHINAQKTEYFRHLIFRETPLSDTRGNHQIDEATAQNETHYRFVYDRQNRLIEVSHRLGDYIINDNDNWDSFIWFSPKMTIEYKDNQEIRYYYNRLDKRIEAHGKMYKTVYDLDSNGKRVAVRFYDKENNPSESAWNIHRYEWTHLGNGKVLEKRFNLKNESQPIRPNFTFHTVRLEYGNDDLLDFVYHLDDKGNIINNTMKAGLDRIVYDNEHNFSRWMVFDKDLKPVNGNAPEFAIGEHLYDTKGNKVELRGFGVVGERKAMPTGVARVLNTYDKYNNQIEVKALDLEDRVLQHVKRQFSKDGKRIEWIRYVDEQDNLKTPRGVNFAAIEFRYAEDGSMAKRVFYDTNMKQVER